MSYKIKLTFILINSLLFLILAFPQPLFLKPEAVAESEAQYQPSQDEEVFGAAVASFALFSSLLQDVIYPRDSIYPVVTRADNLKAAIDYLSVGFQADLAENMANYYLGWDEELSKLVVIPTDSIPLLTMADRQETRIVFINDKYAVLQRIYQQCYAEQDSYIYTIHVRKEISGWKISELSLEEIK